MPGHASGVMPISRMMQWSPRAVAAATSGELRWLGPVPGDPDEAMISSVVIDSRLGRQGSLFVALRGERDGHDFIAAAIAAGAAGVLLSEPAKLVSSPATVAAIVTRDTGSALLALGTAARDRLAGPVVGITGSVGKTSTKDLALAALSGARRAVASDKSFNNELGVPLTLTNAPDDTEVAVIEMGARGAGHIRLLCKTARPTIGVVTSVAPAHTELFGSLDAIAAAKGELVEALPPSGHAILNADDPRVAAMARRAPTAGVVFYSAASRPPAGATVVAENINLDGQLRPSFTVRSPWGATKVCLPVHGEHQVGNALAALAIAGVCGVAIGTAAQGLAGARLSPWRMELRQARSGAAILNDAYNANPASTAAALRSLAALKAERRAAVLGVMAELGSDSDEQHRRIAELASGLGIRLVTVGTDAYGPAPAASIDEALSALGPLDAGDAVLVKGSRVAGLDVLAARLLEL
jgi:UDP-N-acetylmuramoyl-tripeptide--D-alanyl-D-alanine ligase